MRKGRITSPVRTALPTSAASIDLPVPRQDRENFGCLVVATQKSERRMIVKAVKARTLPIC